MASPPPPGYYVPATLFFDENEELDLDAIRSHLLRLAQGGVTGILVQGSNGEAQHLDRQERKKIIQFTRTTLDENGFNNVVLIAGTGAQSTRETKQLCFDAKEAGASYVLVLTPSTWPPQMTADNVIRFHRQVADAVNIPYMIYNFPVVTAGIDLDSDTIATLARHPNIVGVKLSCGQVGKLHRLASTFSPSEFAVFAGRSDIFLTSLLCGGSGVIGATVNVLPKSHGNLLQLYRESRLSEAFELQAKLGHADWAIQKLGGISGVKAIVCRNWEYGKPIVRGPLKPVAVESLVGNKYAETLQELISMEK
ncbi:hypothetical protein MIND_00228700 [Mycena indigotica]|uniref:Dihydrodipicolinate synthase n=1 Tax=Mycena indigotica TaxID=2126181 RepID=A0A8H6TA65_9AGAR|nr:uncharacterized protein MIND_00228700 [Mycena indigotica]KAF7312160.1 hypothetical protein MIND_00228700 [Mycena indigotica]